MAWTTMRYSCGHEGESQLYGKGASRNAEVARAAGRKCFVCWLLEQWKESSDPRAGRVDFARAIAEGKGQRYGAAQYVADVSAIDGGDVLGTKLSP